MAKIIIFGNLKIHYMLHYLKKPVNILVLIFIIQLFIPLSAQNISLEEIWEGRFYPKSINRVSSMKNGKQYTLLSSYGIEKYSYESSDKLETVVHGDFTDYKFSPNEEYLLLEDQSIPIYRRSKLGAYKIYNIKNGTYNEVFQHKLIQEPTFSPDGLKLAFVFENNIYYQDLSTSKVVQVTQDGEKNKIINGITDWVYEEELGFVRSFEWSPDSKSLAFIRFDESAVKEIDLPVYGKFLYPEHMVFKYPKAGEDNSKVSLHLYNLEKNKISDLSLQAIENYYIIKIRFSPVGNLLVLTANRNQNKVDVSSLDINSEKVTNLFSHTSKTWIDTDAVYLEFLQDGSFIMNSSEDGYNHLYLYNKKGKKQKQLTKGKWEVTEIYGVDPDQTIYFQTTKKGAKNRNISKVNIKNLKHTLLAPENGTHDADFSSDFSYFIDKFSTADTPPVYTLRDKEGKILKTLEDNSSLLSFASKKEIRPLEFIEIPNGKGENLKAYIIRPKNFNPAKKYPILMYTYGGPGVQTVKNSWDSFNYWWYQMLAQQGYIIVSVDGRGTGGRGDAFKKVTYKQLGKLELEDQLAAAHWLKSKPYVDGNRIGIWGWSFGGYLTSLCMTKGNGTFKMGIAVAPVTNWRYYDTIYTERFLQTPQENATGYEENSPINFAGNLQGNYLIIHGTADDNVHFQNSVEMVEALIQEAKQFDMMMYPDKNHGIYGGATRYQLYQKMTNYIKTNL